MRKPKLIIKRIKSYVQLQHGRALRRPLWRLSLRKSSLVLPFNEQEGSHSRVKRSLVRTLNWRSAIT
ncbi:unnamed protein product [Cuscuta campestris]|uniref:Uncharacterized protein n=1 Tax=Cuscuta campestris TaxID=132261 RepID=A0A484M5D6_9ASTE|nr:unnamed protein product [Cuscuta campestris]VFQ83973.1 unnamed protein product [Cuscuta campestris]